MCTYKRKRWATRVQLQMLRTHAVFPKIYMYSQVFLNSLPSCVTDLPFFSGHAGNGWDWTTATGISNSGKPGTVLLSG